MHNIENGNVNYSQLLHHTYEDALMRNEHTRNHWQKLREEYKTLESLLNDLPKDLSKDVMVPVAPRALMPGKIVHTNEILVCLGQGYFVKRSATQATEICKRREKICSDMLESLEKERQLFIGRKELPLQEDAFGREIIEEYNEEEEIRWKAEHKRKEQEYRQKLAELRTKEKTAVVDEESLWQRLDELELQEELEEELDRLHAEDSDLEEEEEGIEEQDNDDDNEKDEDGSDGEADKELQREENSSSEETPPTCPSLGRRVSFAGLEDGNAEELRIEFHHSNETSSELAGTESIRSPAELYTHFKNQFLAEPKSILKKTTSYDNSLGNALSEDSQGEITEYESAIDISPYHLPPPVLEEVVERDSGTSSSTPATERPVSRFKALRQRMKL